jgi:hypothetical protein
MTNPEVLVDTIQHGKKQFIKKYMKHPELSQAWNHYVDAQSVFVKQALKTNETTALLIMEKLIWTHGEKLFNPFGIDWFEAGWDAAVKNNLKK